MENKGFEGMRISGGSGSGLGRYTCNSEIGGRVWQSGEVVGW